MAKFQFGLINGNQWGRQIGLAFRAHGDQIRPSALIENLAFPTRQAVSHKLPEPSKAGTLFVRRSLMAMHKPMLAWPTGRRGRLGYASEGVRVKPGSCEHLMDGAVGGVNGERALA
ncbi:hypothetical protein ORS3428_30060 [Mesorhizobium sp. ORS 3428]|nr:hypothetical protein ORS3428_27570 [Mesorhizobium sp. ORS 3428]OHV89881.1 hypothetical protein ORS3428_30060 [Mesorhizobium sp. ORS 3428]